jgi:hypothetical protein
MHAQKLVPLSRKANKFDQMIKSNFEEQVLDSNNEEIM